MNEPAVRISLELAAIVKAVRAYVERTDHPAGGCAEDPCELCVALAKHDGRAA